MKISRTAIKISLKSLIENLNLQDGLLDLSLNEKLITLEGKEDCESNPDKSIETFLYYLYRDKRHTFSRVLKFLILLEKQCKHHLVNHVIGFGVHWPNFEKKWPLNTKTKFRIADTACGNNELIWSMKIEDEVDCRSIELKGIENTETSYMRDRLTRNLVSLLVENRCFTFEKEQKLKQLEQKQKQHELLQITGEREC